jgi:tRNA(Ile)-lysidine synthase
MDVVETSSALQTTAGGLAERLNAHLESSGLLREGAAITVALSGGLDSVALLDLLQELKGSWNWSLSAAHFDHRMRAESETDADWVREFCEVRGVRCLVERSDRRPGNEAEARELRYEFLHRARARLGGERLATAHQADDQAETVLFRLLRGSGLAGLAGIPARREPSVVRPLLPFWRAEIDAYLRSRGIDYLIDPSNRDLSYARNRIRHELIPAIEADGCADLRRQLYRLSTLAARATRVVECLTEKAADDLVLEASESRIIVARSGFLAYDTKVRAHLLRALAARLGPRPGRVGTRTALEFINTGTSGRGIELAGGMSIRREYDAVLIERPSDEPARDEELVLPDPRSGEGDVKIAGVGWRVRWALGAPEEGAGDGEEVACFVPSELRFPLTVRGWRPGDRIRLPAGTRKIKRLFSDRKVGRSQRRFYPLLADVSGVLWVVGLARGARAAPREGGAVLSVRLERKR